MNEIVVSCSCCGRQMVFPSECVLLECPACGTRNARPRSTGAELNILKRAVDQRLACDFHNAEKSYQHVLLEYPAEHEALWGLLLCHYGVEYVDEDEPAPSFDDVAPDKWYSASIEYCVANGLMEGDGNGKFRPDEPITRAEVAAVAERLHKMLG